MPEQQPVLIAGAGPAGMITALGLARRGVPVKVFEVDADLPETRRATTFHPPTLDMLDELGLVDDVIRLGQKAPTWQFRDRETGCVAEFDVSMLADVSGHPYRIQCEQFHLTRLIRDRLAELPNADVFFKARVTEFAQSADGVTIGIEDADGPQTCSGSFLVGADGGRSVIRATLPVEFEGFTYDERIVQAGTTFDYASALPDVGLINYISDPQEWCVLLALPGYWRVGFPMREGETEEDALTNTSIQARLQRFFPKSGDYELVHRNTWRVHQRVASNFRHGRVLLAGDAAHVNSPQGGMGMNSGIHDGINLAEKLAAVWKGEADAELLDRYVRQRRHVAVEDVRVQTMRNAKLMNERDLTLRAKALDDMRATAADPKRARQFLLNSSMIAGLRAAAEIE
jgi:3-(3-hydroxy-phenyl)propionate hydroxylase